jgi:uncharacterized membrane protein YeaQ/YmgE (transglycosylase-associated protein family)
MVGQKDMPVDAKSPERPSFLRSSWGVLGAILGYFFCPRFFPLTDSYPDDALNPIYGACIGAIFGLAVERKHSRTSQRPALFGIAGAFVGLWFGEAFRVQGRDLHWGETEALRIIYGMCIGAGIGFAVDVATSKRNQPLCATTFSLRTLFAACYIVAVLIYIIRGLVIIHGW